MSGAGSLPSNLVKIQQSTAECFVVNFILINTLQVIGEEAHDKISRSSYDFQLIFKHNHMEELMSNTNVFTVNSDFVMFDR